MLIATKVLLISFISRLSHCYRGWNEYVNVKICKCLFSNLTNMCGPNFHLLQVVYRHGDTQPEVVENLETSTDEGHPLLNNTTIDTLCRSLSGNQWRIVYVTTWEIQIIPTGLLPSVVISCNYVDIERTILSILYPPPLVYIYIINFTFLTTWSCVSVPLPTTSSASR